MTEVEGFLARGDYFQAGDDDTIAIVHDGLIEVDAAGRCRQVVATDGAGRALIDRHARAGSLFELPAGTCLMPGMVDLHCHAPQYAQLGTALDLPLEDWLQHYTFPTERRFADLDVARTVYGRLVADLLAAGTTTAMYFATIHLDATKLLADICLAHGQRALIGKVTMDAADTCPADYRDASPAAAIAANRALIAYLDDHPDNAGRRVLPVITPRFIPACSDEVLRGLGELARETGCHVQTHCSESDWEHGHVLDRHGMTDAHSLDRFGLLGERTVLAHGNFLDDRDFDLLHARGAAVAHCPLSNIHFAGAVFPLASALARSVHVGLGSDVSGGYDPAMLGAIRTAFNVSRLLDRGVDPSLPPERRGRPDMRVSLATAFALATRGGGEALGLPIGLFRPGYHFDAVLIDYDHPHGGIRRFDSGMDQDLVARILLNATAPNLSAVWVGGRLVSNRGARVG